MTDELGLRERKKRERRRRIEDAAIALFQEQGFDDTTIEQIASAADIAPRTFFSYFATKEDVVLADYAQRLDRIVGELTSRPAAEPPWAALRAAFVTVSADYEASREALATRFRIMAANPSVFARSLQLQAAWEAALADALRGRIGRAGNDLVYGLLSSAALAAMRSSLQHWVQGGLDAALPELVQGCFDQLADGLAEVT